MSMAVTEKPCYCKISYRVRFWFSVKCYECTQVVLVFFDPLRRLLWAVKDHLQTFPSPKRLTVPNFVAVSQTLKV